MTLSMIHVKQLLARIHHLWSYMNAGPQGDWDRVYLCSVAPMSAEALRENEEAERIHAPH